MKRTVWTLGAVVCLAAAAAVLYGQMSGGSTVEMKGMKPVMKLQSPVEGFMTPLNGKIDIRATEIDFEPGGGVGDHFHFGPGIRAVLAGELTLTYGDTGQKKTVRAGEYFYETGDVNIHGTNTGKGPAKVLVVELVPANLKGSAMVPMSRRAELAADGARLKQQICGTK